MSSGDDIKATRTRPFATTIAADSVGYGPMSAREPGPQPELGSIVGLHYRLVRPLGEGNFGKVWVAERLDVPEHRVAIKILPRSHFVGRNVERELVMLATVGHPNVVQLKDHGIEPDFVWLTMPVYEGETLAERLERGSLTLREAYEIFLPIARAVEALHTLGLRHQDIKPENIFLSRFGGRLHPVLLDLGVAAEKDATFVAGTALYAAPEQLAAILQPEEERQPLSEKIDSYCLAATLLLSLVGDRYFPGAKALTRRQVMESHEVRASKPLADGALLELSENVRGQLNEKLAKWMALNPDERPNMTRVAEELDVLLEPEREAEEAAVQARARQRRSLARARWVALFVLIGAGALGGVALWKRETLRMASALEQARAAGEENFDKLDTCVAAHTLTKREAKVCDDDLKEERAEHEKTLTSLAQQGEGCSAAVDQIKDLRATMQLDKKKHEDELRAETKTCTTEKEKLSTDFGAERDKLKSERDTCDSKSKELAAELTRAQQERDTCVASAAATPSPSPTGNPISLPTSQPTSSPTSSPTSEPTSTPTVHETPPPPPPPDPTAPAPQSTLPGPDEPQPLPVGP